MSHILRNDETLEQCRFFVEKVKKEGFSYSLLEQVLEVLVPCSSAEEPLIQYCIAEKGRVTAVFYPSIERIDIGSERLFTWVTANARDLADFYSVSSSETLSLIKVYLFFFVLSHEVEHSYQYLIGQGKVESPCSLVTEGYRTLYGLLVPYRGILPRPIYQTRRIVSKILYHKHENELVLERNANLDALDFVCQLILYCHDVEVYPVFSAMKNTFVAMGYIRDTKGSLEETFSAIHFLRSYQKMKLRSSAIDVDTRLQYGLEIDTETREKVLQLLRKK